MTPPGVVIPPRAVNEREGRWFDGRLLLRCAWAVNWALGFQFFLDEDYLVVSFEPGPLRFNFYARWGLTEDERVEKWARDL